MSYIFEDSDLDRIGSVLGVSPKMDDKLARFELFDEDSGRHLSLEILTELHLPENLETPAPNNLISVYAAGAFLQMQGCTGFIASKELGEVIFVAREGGKTSGLVIEAVAAASLFANVSEKLLSTDFQKLPPEMIMSSIALSMAETLFSDLDG